MDTLLLERIRSWVSSQRELLTRDLCDLVSIPSVSHPGDVIAPFGLPCRHVLDVMLEKGQKLGLYGTCYDYCFGSLSLGEAEMKDLQRCTGIWTHLDVVPAGDGWSTPPFQATLHDGLVTGRGSQDNKSAAVMGLYLLKGLKELGLTLTHPVVLFFGVSEECGMQDLDAYLAAHPAPGLSLVADCGFPICYGEKGSMQIRISTGDATKCQPLRLFGGTATNIIPDYAWAEFLTPQGLRTLSARGLGGHAANPAGSENALFTLLVQLMESDFLAETDRSILRPFLPLLQTTDGSPAGIQVQSSQWGDLTCCGSILRCEKGFWSLDLDIRYPYGTDTDYLIRQLQNYAEAQGCRIQVLGNLPAMGNASDTPEVRSLTETYNELTHSQLAPFTMAGATYAAKLPNAYPYGISFPDKPAIRSRYPKGHGDYHQPDESVEIDAILEALVIYLMALIRLDQARS